MRVSSAIALLVFGAAVFVGLGALLYKTVLGVLFDDTTFFYLVIAGASALVVFVFGILLGYIYEQGASGAKKMSGPLRERFRKALDFERQQRVRLERELFETKRLIVGLEDNLVKATFQHKAIDDSKEQKEQFDEMAVRYNELRNSLILRKERIVDLQVELSVAQTEAERAKQETEIIKSSMAPVHPTAQVLLDGPSMKDILEEIAALEGIKMVLVADDYGLVVDEVGEGLPSESLAAISSLIAHLGPRVRDVLPMGRVNTVSLGDDQGLVLDTHYFDLLGTRCAIAIAREEENQYPGLAKMAAEKIASRME